MTLEQIFGTILVSSALGFGGFGSLPFVRQHLAAAGLAADTLLLQALTVGRLSPGPNGLFLVALGYFVAGVPGGIAAFVALLIPPLSILPISHLRSRFDHLPRFRAAMRSLSLGVVALLANSTMSIVKQAVTSPAAALIVVGAAVLLLRRLPPWLLLAASGLAGWLFLTG